MAHQFVPTTSRVRLNRTQMNKNQLEAHQRREGDIVLLFESSLIIHINLIVYFHEPFNCSMNDGRLLVIAEGWKCFVLFELQRRPSSGIFHHLIRQKHGTNVNWSLLSTPSDPSSFIRKLTETFLFSRNVYFHDVQFRKHVSVIFFKRLISCHLTFRTLICNLPFCLVHLIRRNVKFKHYFICPFFNQRHTSFFCLWASWRAPAIKFQV